MIEKTDWEKVVRRMERLLRLKSFPVAFKMLANKEELAQIPFLRRTQNKSTLCQIDHPGEKFRLDSRGGSG